MRVNKKAIFVILVGILMTGCSFMNESKLVGQWQSKGPESVRLNITNFGTNDEGFHRSYSSTSNGQTYTHNWRIESGNELVLQDDSFWGGFAKRGGLGSAVDIHYKIIELTSDRLVIQFEPVVGRDKGKIQEFQRVK